MAERDERASIIAKKSHKKYGSTSNHMKRNEMLIKHTVSPGETLQGIALKYGITMERIKRANKIWTNDSIFLHKTLEIPIPSTSLDELHLEANGGDLVTSSEGCCSSLTSSSSGPSSAASTVVQSPSDCEMDLSDQSIADILIRIDSSIAQTRTQVEKREKLQEGSDFDPDEILLTASPRSRLYKPHHRSRMSQESGCSLDDHQVTIMTQGRKVQSSLQRLQKQQDEMFEL